MKNNFVKNFTDLFLKIFDKTQNSPAYHKDFHVSYF